MTQPAGTDDDRGADVDADAAQELANTRVATQSRAGLITALIGTPICLAAYAALGLVIAGHSRSANAGTLFIIFGVAIGPLVLWVGVSLRRTATAAATLISERPVRCLACTRSEVIGRRRSRRVKTVVLLSDPQTGVRAGAVEVSEYERWQGLPENASVYCWGAPRGGQVVLIASLDLQRAYAARITHRSARRWAEGVD